MVSTRALLSAGMGIAALAAGAEAKEMQKPRNMVPGGYIFEFHEGADTSSFYEEIGSHGLLKRDYNYNLFKGAAYHFHDIPNAERRAADLAARPEVRNVFPIQRYPIPKREVQWQGKPGRDYSRLRRRDEGSEDVFSTHVMTGVNLLHDEGIDGSGIKIAVIDSGIDYNHPALGGCFGDGCLISYGKDLVGDDYTGSNEPVPSDDPMDCDGHGTHVAGTIAAQRDQNSLGIIGAAPGVTLGAYKVFGCDGSVSNDILISAFNEAYEAGSDIITASIGGVSGWKEDPWAVAVQRIIENGVPCTISAGNEGDMGLWYASGAADAKGAASIASVDNYDTPELLTISTYSIDSGSDEEFGWVDGSPNDWEDVTMPLYATSHDTEVEDDACTPLPDDTPDLTDYVVLIRQGGCGFDEKAANAAAFGAQYVLIYSIGDTIVDTSADGVDGIFGIAMTGLDVGETFVQALADGKEVIVTMTHPDAGEYRLQLTRNTITGGSLSVFTTWGPTYEGDLKPQFASPGGNILSTYPLAKGSYARLSGTSMACPLAAGAYALIAQKRGTFDPTELERIVSQAAIPLQYNDGSETYDGLAPVAQQGAGLIDAYAAAYATSIASVSSIAWNDTDHFEAEVSFDIENFGDDDVTFVLDFYPALTAYTFDEGSSSIATFPMEVTEDSATITFDKNEVKVPAGGKTTVRVTASPPDLDEDRLPIWSGYLSLNGTDGSILTIPYQGIGGSLHSQKILGDAEDGVFLGVSTMEESFPTAVEEGYVFTLPPKGHTSFDGYEVPTVVAELLFGSRLVEVLIVPLDGTDPGVDVSKSKLRRRKGARPHASAQEEDTVGFMGSIGEPAGFAGELQPRGMGIAVWDGSLAGTGEYVNEGSYKFVVRALRIFGDDSDGGVHFWDIVETVGFEIKYDTA
jgi:subtilisin family serine protease